MKCIVWGLNLNKDFVLHHLNLVSRESVIQFRNPSNQSMAMQTLTWDVGGAVAAIDGNSDVYLLHLLRRQDKMRSKPHYNIL